MSSRDCTFIFINIFRNKRKSVPIIIIWAHVNTLVVNRDPAANYFQVKVECACSKFLDVTGWRQKLICVCIKWLYAQGKLSSNYNVALIAIRWYRIVLCKISLHMMNEDETSQRVVKEWDMVETSSIGVLERHIIMSEKVHMKYKCGWNIMLKVICSRTEFFCMTLDEVWVMNMSKFMTVCLVCFEWKSCFLYMNVKWCFEHASVYE